MSFDVDSVASPGHLFVARSRDDFIEIFGHAAGVDIHNALQKGF